MKESTTHTPILNHSLSQARFATQAQAGSNHYSPFGYVKAKLSLPFPSYFYSVSGLVTANVINMSALKRMRRVGRRVSNEDSIDM